MKKLVIICALFLAGKAVTAQEIDTNYFPQQNNVVSDVDYKKGLNILTNSYIQIKESAKDPIYADYWNVAVGLAYMGENQNLVRALVLKAKQSSNQAFCIIINYQFSSIASNYRDIPFYKMFGDEYLGWVKECTGIENTKMTLEQRFAEKEKLNLTGLNEALIDRLIILIDKDQRYRHSSKKYDANIDVQNALDRENEIEIVKIFEEYGYPGKSLVGEKYMSYGCLILEHIGQSPNQDKYLSLVTDALKKGEVGKGPVRMLLDRIYWKNTGKQIFGSHIGIPFADDDVIEEVKAKYGL